MSNKANINDIIAALVNHSDDVVDIVNRVGLVNIIQSAPAMFRILKEVADRKEAMEDAEKTLYYSTEIKERVKAFQRKHGLEPDGLVGNKTWEKVERLLEMS